MKPILYCFFLLQFSIFGFGQSAGQLSQLKPKWKLGDKKIVQNISVSKIFIKDSLLSNTEVKGYYNLQVIDTNKNYTILFSNNPNSAEVETQSSVPQVDSVLNFFTGLIRNIEKETIQFKYELLVDKTTGQAFKVKNGAAFLQMVERVATSMIDEVGRSKEKKQIEIDSMKQKVITYFKTAEPKILETTLNQFNYLMQAHSYTFKKNSTTSEKTMIHDVNALGEFGGIEMPAILTVSSKSDKNSITIKTDTDYDKQFLLELMKKKYKKMNNLTTEDFSLSEKTESVFNTGKNWITSHRSDVVFKLQEVMVINQTIVIFQ